jgi:bla regulator protein BlaR1
MIGELTNHLWQSTLFAVAAGLLAIACQKNRAQVRFWLWMSSSLKFLVPLSFLANLYRHIQWAAIPAEISTGTLSVKLIEITQPFPGFLSVPTSNLNITNLVLPAILGLWFCGFGAVILVRLKAWLRIRAILRSSFPFEIPATVKVRCSQSLLEPGVVGLLHPILLLPAGITDRLTKAQFEAVLAHELCHIRRRDNLTAAIHMLVEAVFWLYPLVWWIGARLVEERERACDEDVLAGGSEPRVYAQAILKVCESYTESPLTCLSGVTGTNLTKRLERIMRNHVGESLNAWRKLMLGIAGLAAVGIPLFLSLLHVTESKVSAAGTPFANRGVLISQGQTQAETRDEFDSASVRQNKSEANASMRIDGGSFSGVNLRLVSYIYFAYNVTGNQFQLLMPQLPAWVVDDRFDIEARADGKPSKDQIQVMLRHLLKDRFKLAMHYESRQLPAFALVLATPGKFGPQLQRHSNDSPCAAPAADPWPQPAIVAADGFPVVCDSIEGFPSSTSRLRVGARRVPLEQLATALAQMGNLDRPAINRTGLSGTFDFTFEWTPQHNGPGTPQPSSSTSERGATFLDDLKQQLGFELEPYSGTVEVLVFDHIDRSSMEDARVH